MGAQSSLEARDRAAVFGACLRDDSPPPVKQVMSQFRLPREEIEASLDRLDAARHLKLVPGTQCVLMAFPFSAVATPYRVVVAGRRSYFANCAWDSIAFHPMPRSPVTVESYCHHCGQPIRFALREGQVEAGPGDAPVVYFGLPAAVWWKDIVFTCANTMLFFASSEHLRTWRAAQSHAPGVELSVEQVLRLSEPLYAGKMEVGYSRPSREVRPSCSTTFS
jgi:hypothetical protein